LPLLLLSPHAGAQQAEQPLVANAQKDAFGIAEQLYAQAHAQTEDAEQRRATYARAAELFGKYARTYPKAADKDKALYLQAAALEEAGDLAASNSVLGTLANTTHGEYAAAAAYKLGTQAADREMWDKAAAYFRIVGKETRRAPLLHDSLYRLGRVLLQQGNRREAESTLQRLLELRNVQPTITSAALLSLAQIKTEKREDAAAYHLYRRLLSMKELEKGVRGMATLQAARLASNLGKDQEAQALYDSMSSMEDMAQYTAEAQLDALVRAYKKKNYEEVIKLASQSYHPLNNPEKEARRALIIGQAYMDLERYEKASPWFMKAEQYQVGQPLGAEAAYRNIVCAQHLRAGNVLSLAQRFLNTYALAGAPTEGLALCDWVRFTYADRIMPADVEEAARQFDAVRIDQLPAAIRPDAEYKKAWSASRGNTYDPIPTLNHFISTYKDDPRTPEAYALRGSVYAKQGKPGEALRDFDYVIANYPHSDVLPMCLQKAAQASTSDPARMVRYYEGLIACNSRVKPAARAEAHYNIARALYDSDTAAAIPHFQEARNMNDRYASMVDQYLVQCYFKLKDAKNLLTALEAQKKNNPASYKALPPGILRWCAWMCYQRKEYLAADQLFTDALEREPKETYTTPEGTQAERPQVEPLVWKCLAKARLELRQYRRGYEAAQHYVSMETQPYRRAEGMRDMAQLLLGLKRPTEARTICEDAIALGIDGPIKSSLFLSLGDTYYAQGNYGEAAKCYGRVANVVSDQELKPLATYKIICALTRCGKDVEAAQYRDSFKTEFPSWAPPSDVRRFMEGADAPAS
ncbi:MAG: tetratricopeptide repeat protein, partial [Akkermansiaceae bacterium]|nr:tetratricopeptide repeat protein [Akkermansiaceae bacterium]